VKVLFRSRLTAENIVGFLFGKMNQPPEYDFIAVPSRYANFLKIDLSEDYTTFMKTFNETKTRLFNQIPETADISREFCNYVKTYIVRKGPSLFGSELSAALRDNDSDLVHYILEELTKDWSLKMEIIVEFSTLKYEEISAMSFLHIWEDLDDSNVQEIMKRPDIASLPEAFPIVDPIAGRSITEFDIGDPVFFVVINARDPELMERLQKLFPKNFFEGKNNVPLAGTLVAKELVKTSRRDFYLLKVDMSDGLLARCLVPKNLKIMSDYQRYEMKVASQNEKKWEKELEEMVQEQPQALSSKRIVQNVIREKSAGGDFLIAFLLTVMILGIVFIISYFFFPM